MPVGVPTMEDFAVLEARVAVLEGQGQRPPVYPTPGPLPPGRPERPERPPPGGGGEAGGVATVHLGGADYVYDPADGTDLGAYHDPDGRFSMSCVRVWHDGCALVLDFRSTGADWQCVVVEYSDPLRGDLGNLAYSVTMPDGSEHQAEHYANAAWRWQSAEWPHELTEIDTLYQRKLLPEHDADLACDKAGFLPNVHDCPPMSLCGFTADMGATGGRADIGVVTGWQAELICLGGDDMLRTVLVQGEAAFPWRFRDTTTGCIFDAIKAHPQASLHWSNGPNGNPQLYQGTGPHPGLDAAHAPSCYYVPYLLTGDPWFLEMHQSATMYCFMEIGRNPQTVVGSEQIRGVAWSLRFLANAAMATPDDVPGWLLPKSIFVDELERQRTLLEARQKDGWTYRDFAHVIDSYGRWQHAWWQHDYATAVIAWISMYDDRWAQQRDWMVEGIAGRNDPHSGWCVGYPTSYWTNTTTGTDWNPEGSFKTWAEAWEYNANHVYTDTPGGVCRTLEEHLQINTSYDYMSAMMHALRLASQAGSTRAAETLATLVEPWEAGLRTYGYTELKYCGAAA